MIWHDGQEYDGRTEGSSMTDNAKLSRLLFEAREAAEMLADIVEARSNEYASDTRRLVAEIDEYRAERGWSPNGFGGEQ